MFKVSSLNRRILMGLFQKFQEIWEVGCLVRLEGGRNSSIVFQVIQWDIGWIGRRIEGELGDGLIYIGADWKNDIGIYI